MTTKLTEPKGTGVRAFGTVGTFTLPPEPCSYSIDGGAAMSQVATMISSIQYQNPVHSLLITTLESDPDGGTFYLDFFEVTPLQIDTACPLPSSSPLQFLFVLPTHVQFLLPHLSLPRAQLLGGTWRARVAHLCIHRFNVFPVEAQQAHRLVQVRLGNL